MSGACDEGPVSVQAECFPLTAEKHRGEGSQTNLYPAKLGREPESTSHKSILVLFNRDQALVISIVCFHWVAEYLPEQGILGSQNT